MVQTFWKTIWQSLKKNLNIKLSDDPAIVLLGIYPRGGKNVCSHKNLYLNVHCNFIWNSQKLESAQMNG